MSDSGRVVSVIGRWRHRTCAPRGPMCVSWNLSDVTCDFLMEDAISSIPSSPNASSSE